MNTYHLDVHWRTGNAGTDTLAEHKFQAADRAAAIDEAAQLMRRRPEPSHHLEGQLSRIFDDGDLKLIGEVQP